MGPSFHMGALPTIQISEDPQIRRLLNHHLEKTLPVLNDAVFSRLMKESQRFKGQNGRAVNSIPSIEMRKEEMVQRKRIPHVPADNGIPDSPKSGVSRRNRSQNDDKHWDFLDEIEAPLWVDLTLECQSGYTDKDDEWFHVNHPFHQCSSKQLNFAFSHSAEDHMNLGLDVPGQSSPKLPPSVSKSRGTEYRSRHKLQGIQTITFNNQHTVKNLNNKSSFVSSGSTGMTGSRTSKGKNNELPGSNSDSRGKNNLTENVGQHDTATGTVPPLGDQKFSSNSNFFREGESSSASTIASEGSVLKQQQNSLEVSSHVPGQARGFLSALKISLRKSCVTRQASRVEVPNGRLSEGQKSSSGKSSIGSSSSLGYDKKILTARNNKDMTPSNRDIRKPVARHQKVHEANLSNAPGIRFANPKLQSQSFKAPSINERIAKLKQVPHGVSKKCPSATVTKAKKKAVVRDSGRIPAGGKENLAGKMASCQKSSTKSNMQVQKVTTRFPEKIMRTTSLVQKERINERSKCIKTGKMAGKVYIR